MKRRMEVEQERIWDLIVRWSRKPLQSREAFSLSLFFFFKNQLHKVSFFTSRSITLPTQAKVFSSMLAGAASSLGPTKACPAAPA